MTLSRIETMPAAPTLAVEPAERLDVGGLLGLVDGAERPLPLRSLRVRAAIAGDACRTVVEQTFANAHDAPLEALYLFPLPAGGAVVEMELRAGDRVVRGECRDREEAERAFAEARDAGRRAALLTEERLDVYAVRVTNLPPASEVTVRLVISERLEHADGRFLWRFPTVIAPRFLPGTPIGHEGPGILPDTDRVPDASRLQPPLRLEGGVPLDMEATVAAPVTEISSSLHAVRLHAPGDGGVWRIAPSQQATLDRDFVLSFTSADPAAVTTRAWSDGRHTLVVVEPPSGASAAALPRDAVFVIDVSGSMSGPKLAAARLALKTALHGLVIGDRFAMIGFDDLLYPFEAGGLLPYADDALGRADTWIDGLQARGGTMLLPALQAALAGDAAAGRLRTVLLITDGEVWNDSELLAEVARRRGSARLFTIGIDTTSGALLERLARAGGGTHDMLAPSDDIEAAVARLEARYGSPLVDGITATGGTLADDTPRTLFAGRPASLLLEGNPAEVVVTGTSADGAFRACAPVTATSTRLGPLWARERVLALETHLAVHPDREEAVRPEIVRVALEHRIASRFTAWVAVDTSVTSEGERLEIVQPVQLPHTWDRAQWPGRDALFLSTATVACSPSAALQYVSCLRAPTDFAAPHAMRSRSTLSPRRLQPEEARDGDPTVLREDAGPVTDEPCGSIARAVSADGSVAGNVGRTAAALAILVLVGHTRHLGIRRRAVAKTAAWLEGRREHPAAALALDLLRDAEAGADIDALRQRHWAALSALEGFADWAAVAWG